PLDWYLVELPGGRLEEEIIAALADLSRRGVIRLLDLVIVRRTREAGLATYELEDVAPLDARRVADLGSLRTLLSAADLDRLAETLEPGTTAACLVWENLALTSFTTALRGCGGRPVANGRISQASLLAMVDEDLRSQLGPRADA